MTPQDHWNHISPRHPSDSLRGWHFPKDEPKKGSLRGIVFAVLAGALIVAGLIAWWL